jgi:hypothetical protein
MEKPMQRPEDENADDHAKTEVLRDEVGKPVFDPNATAVMDEEHQRRLQAEIKTRKPR